MWGTEDFLDGGTGLHGGQGSDWGRGGESTPILGNPVSCRIKCESSFILNDLNIEHQEIFCKSLRLGHIGTQEA